MLCGFLQEGYFLNADAGSNAEHEAYNLQLPEGVEEGPPNWASPKCSVEVESIQCEVREPAAATREGIVDQQATQHTFMATPSISIATNTRCAGSY